MSTIRLFADDDSLNARVAATLRSLRGLYGMTQTDLAAVIDVNQSYMSKKLRGMHPFALSEIEAFAAYFSTTPGYLLGYEDGPTPRDPRRNDLGSDVRTRHTGQCVDFPRRRVSPVELAA